MNILIDRTWVLSLVGALVLSGLAGPAQGLASSEPDGSGPVEELEAFSMRESQRFRQGGLDPSSRPVSSVFSGDWDAMDIPRSVTVVTSEHMKLLGIEDLRGVSQIGAGTQLINHYGVTGSPILRGVKGATLLNGMVRGFNLNEMPLSLGSCEAMDIVKGPTPPHITPTHVGGFINLLPKSPHFDLARGSVEVSMGSFEHYRLTVDYGAPWMWGRCPSAWRFSHTLNRSGGYYDRVGNDYESLYLSLKTQIREGLTVFGGVEGFRYRSNENAGWNRPTQDLIDRGLYIIGEPVNVSDPGFGGTANRDLVSFPWGFGFKNGIEDFNALVVSRDVVDAAVNDGLIPASARDAMLDLADPDDRARAYGQVLPSTGEHDPKYRAKGPVADVLAGLSTNDNSGGYRYTRDYFDLGGVVFTEAIEGNQVLSDSDDKSEAENWVGFLNVRFEDGLLESWESKMLVDVVDTEKLSSYGYAIETSQRVFAHNIERNRPLDFGLKTDLSYGIGWRATKAEMIQDYYAEPFSRRDISRKAISRNSVVIAGPQEGPDGLNYWSPDIGANVASMLWQGAVFGQLSSRLTESFTATVSMRAERAWYDLEMPDEVERASAEVRDSLDKSGDKDIYSIAAYGSWAFLEDWRLYAAVQDGVAVDLTQGGGVMGEENFAQARLTEIGIKNSLMDGRFQGALSGWAWEQSRYNDRDAQSEPLEGKGVEFEMTATLVPGKLFLIGSTEYQKVRRKIGLGYRALPLTQEEWALNGGVLNGGVDPFPEGNPKLYYPGFPENTVKAHLVWKPLPMWSAALSIVYSQAYWLNFERTLRLPSSCIVNARIGWQAKQWECALQVENLTDEDHYLGADPLFSSNTLVTKGEPIRYSVKVRYAF